MTRTNGQAVWIDAAGAQMSVERLAAQVAESVRALNHLTRPAVSALTTPSQLCELIASLAYAAHRMPQLLQQLSQWLDVETRAGRVRVDVWSPVPDAGEAAELATAHLMHARQYLHRAALAMDEAHELLAHAATAGPDEDEAGS